MSRRQIVQMAAFTGHSLMGDRRHAVLIFSQPNGEWLNVAVPLQQAPLLVAAGAALGAVARRVLGAKAPPPATFKVERWSMAPQGDTTVLTFHLAGGTQLCLEVTPETVREGAAP